MLTTLLLCLWRFSGSGFCRIGYNAEFAADPKAMHGCQIQHMSELCDTGCEGGSFVWETTTSTPRCAKETQEWIPYGPLLSAMFWL